MGDIPRPICRSCGHHWDHHRRYNVWCTGDDGRCRCEHYWAPEQAYTIVGEGRNGPVVIAAVRRVDL